MTKYRALAPLFLFAATYGHAQQKGLENNPPMGQAIYEQTGSNSCLFCHGVAGHDGKVKQAADLTKPKTWKTYKAIGGDAALQKNPEEFNAHMAEAIAHLIIKSSAAHTPKTFERPWFNWAATGAFNSQMQGLKGAASQSWLKRFSEKGVTPEIAAKNLVLYVEKFDSQGVFKK